MSRSGSMVACACALLASGCLLADRSLYYQDGGADPDAGDAEIEDGGTDAGDGATCAPSQVHERACTGGRDEDCDGFVDCNDVDCATALACCGEGGTAIVSEFSGPTADWISLPTTASPPIAPSGGTVSNFYSGEPRALRYRECVPIDLGVELRAVLRVNGTDTCSTPPCPYAGLVLTPLREMARGVPLPDELSVRVSSDRHVEVQRAGATLWRSVETVMAGDIDVTVQLTPGVDDAGNAWVYSAIQIVHGALTWYPWGALGDLRASIPREDLRDANAGCTEARGLYLALEGRGARVEIDSVTIDPRQCANPSHFEAIRGGGFEIDAAGVGATPRWSSGGIGAPALASYFLGGASTETWALVYDASDLPRTNELSAPMRFSIGLSTTNDADGLASWTARGNPLLGRDPPNCSGCDQSVRDPAAYLPIDEDDRSLDAGGWLVYAREIPGSGARRYQISGRPLLSSPIGTGSMEYLLLDPASEGGDCESLRDPLLLPIEPADPSQAWLLYTCIRRGRAVEIRAARFEQTGADDPRATPLGVAVLSAAELGPIAGVWMRGADGAAWFVGGDRVIYRLWVATRDLAGETAIAFAEWTGARGVLPDFAPYDANPVLRTGDPILGDCTGAIDCDIDAIGVTRVANAPNTVRLLVARTITTTGGARQVLVPLDQVWPAPR